MIKELMSKIGYYKVNKQTEEILNVLRFAFVDKRDIFIDFVKKENVQKLYMKGPKGGKAKLIATIRGWER